MKRQGVILGIVVVLTCIGLSGCQEVTNSYPKDELDIEKMILGSWKWVESIVTIEDNTTSFTDTENYTITTYYDNGTVKISIIGRLPPPPYDPYPDDIMWNRYRIENNNQIFLSNFTENGTFPWKISISEDGKNLTLCYEFNYGNFTRETSRYIKIESTEL